MGSEGAVNDEIFLLVVIAYADGDGLEEVVTTPPSVTFSVVSVMHISNKRTLEDRWVAQAW